MSASESEKEYTTVRVGTDVSEAIQSYKQTAGLRNSDQALRQLLPPYGEDDVVLGDDVATIGDRLDELEARVEENEAKLSGPVKQMLGDLKERVETLEDEA